MFPKNMFNSITDYVNANYTSPVDAPTITLDDLECIYETSPNRATSIKFNSDNCKFKELIPTTTEYSTTCLNMNLFYSSKSKIVDLNKVIIGPGVSCGIYGGKTEPVDINEIRNVTIRNAGTIMLFNGNKCKAITNIKVENGILGISNGGIERAYQNLTTLTFKPNCTFKQVFIWQDTLTKESIINLFNALQKLDEGNTRTCRIGSTLLAKLTDEDKKIATDKGWTLA